MTGTTQSEIRLASMLDERETVMNLHEAAVASVQTNEDKLPSEAQSQMIRGYREKEIALDVEIETLTEDIERNRRAIESSKAVRRVLVGNTDGVEMDGDQVAYRSMAAYARDVILTGVGQTAGMIAGRVDKDDVQLAVERLQLAKRTPANTLSSNIPGLQPPQYIDQIFQVINKSRPIVDSARRSSLVRGTLTYPKITQRPLVAVQATEKTEAGNQGMLVTMQQAIASTYLGGGDLSWQAINWSTPDALDLWFELAAADYALKTETDAGDVLTDSSFSHAIGSTLSGAWTFANLMTAVGAGYAAVFTNSGRIANTVYMAPDVYGYLLGLTSSAFSQFVNVSGDAVGPLNVVVTRGLAAGEIIVGDAAGLLVAETDGAPVELRVVEPAIGGVEVGIIGAFEAVVVDDGAFALITTAS